MAFSLLRNSVKHSLGILERSVYSVSVPLIQKEDTSQLITNQNCHYSTICDTCELRFQNLRIVEPKSVVLRYYGSKQKQYQERKLDYDSDSDSDSDKEDHHHHHHKKHGKSRGESDFWRRKIRTFHGILDVNKDGVISFDDFKLLSDRFVNLGHLSDTHKKEFQDVIKRAWETQWGEITPYNLVTVEQYLEDMHHVLNDKALKKKVHAFLPYLFKAVDKDNSGEISVEEFKLFFKCLGLPDECAILSFNAIDTNQDGKLSFKEFVKLGRDFFVTEDETKVSRMFWGPLIDH